MTPSELLNKELMDTINNKYLGKKNKLIFKRSTRTLHARLGSNYWKEHYKAIKKNKKRIRKLQNKKYRRIPKKYDVYIKSSWWDTRKNRFYKKYGRFCAVCNSKSNVQLHHKYYANYFEEEDSDLVSLCGFHHNQLHLAIGKTKRDMRKETESFIDEMRKHFELENRTELM